MHHNIMRSVQRVSIVLGVGAIVSGCGSPDLSVMKPTVVKKSAAVLLVDHPVGWTDSIVRQMQASDPKLDGLTMETIDTTSQQLQSEVQNLLTKHTPTLIIEVFAGAVPSSAVEEAGKNLNIRFELLGTSSPSVHGVNIATIVPSTQVTAYLTGFAAGFSNNEQGYSLLGWLNNSGSKPNAVSAKAMLAGLYAADPTIALTSNPVSGTGTISGTSTNSVGNAVGSTTGNTSGSTLSSTGSVSPKLNVELDSLGKTNTSLVTGEHGQVFSAAMASGPVVSLPIPPGPGALKGDLEKLMKESWASGAKTTTQNISIWVDPKRVSNSAKAALQNLEQTNLTPTYIGAQWNAIPKSKQKQWQQLLGF